MKITLCIPQGKEFKQQLKQEIALTRNIKDRSDRKSIHEGLTRILNNYGDGCHYLWDGKNLQMGYYPFKDFIYECGNDFVIPNINLNDINNKYVFLVMDANDAYIAYLQGKKITTIWKEESNVPRKHDAGGSSQRRFERDREEALKHWLKKVAGKLKEVII